MRLEQGKLAADYSIPMILHCPACSVRHIDEGEFAQSPHHTHACQSCGLVWRPAKVNTHGVRFLPGYRNGQLTDSSAKPSVPSEGGARDADGVGCDGQPKGRLGRRMRWLNRPSVR